MYILKYFILDYMGVANKILLYSLLIIVQFLFDIFVIILII